MEHDEFVKIKTTINHIMDYFAFENPDNYLADKCEAIFKEKIPLDLCEAIVTVKNEYQLHFELIFANEEDRIHWLMLDDSFHSYGG